MTEWSIRLPWDRPPLSLNYRLHRHVEAKVIREVRRVGMAVALQHQIPRLDRVDVTLTWFPGPIRNRDDENPVPTLKALCDGLVDAGVTEDDTARFMVKHMPVIAERDGDPRLVLTLREVS